MPTSIFSGVRIDFEADFGKKKLPEMMNQWPDLFLFLFAGKVAEGGCGWRRWQ
jgi:hypothetical protein